MNRLLNTVAFRLAVGYGALVLCAVAVISAVPYFGTAEHESGCDRPCSGDTARGGLGQYKLKPHVNPYEVT
jgi:hypothetical protein